MLCQSCGKELDRNSIEANGLHFCNNLCRRFFERGSTAPQNIRITPKETKLTITDLPNSGDQISCRATGKESFYFVLKILATIAIIGAAAYLVYLLPKKATIAVSMVLIYGAMIIVFFLIRNVLLAGHIRANAVLVSERQFPEINCILENQAKMLKMKHVPQMYIMQAGGILNAFAMKYAGKHYVVIYSNIIETAYDCGTPALSFIIGHELAHVKRRHIFKNIMTIPSLLVPFLGQAYSRACEYTCDCIGKQLSSSGAVEGMLILAVGTKLFAKIDVGEFAKQLQTTGGFCVWFSEILSSHPHISKRVQRLGRSSLKDQISAVGS